MLIKTDSCQFFNLMLGKIQMCLIEEKIQNAINYIISEHYLNEVISTSKFCSHGSNIIHYFEENDLLEEYVNTIRKKKIIKDYINKNICNIKENLFEELKLGKLYRSILIDKLDKNKGNFGLYWSSSRNTSACVQNDKNIKEYLLEIDTDINKVNFIETIKSRLDVIHGEKEKEIQLYKDSEVIIKNIMLIN